MTIYLYGFVPAEASQPPPSLTGIDDRPVEALGLGGLTAAVSRVADEAYADDALSSRLGDLAWVGQRGLEHERVVTWFVDHGGILPTRLFTLYSSPERLREDASNRNDHIAGLLRRFAGLREWHLKATYDPERMEPHLGETSPEIRTLDEEIAASAAGRGYLLKRKRAALAGERSASIARLLALELLGGAQDLVLDTVHLAVPDGTSGRIVLNVALLVEASRGDALHRHLDRHSAACRQRGLDVEYSGPWAPYRFVPEESEARDSGMS